MDIDDCIILVHMFMIVIDCLWIVVALCCIAGNCFVINGRCRVLWCGALQVSEVGGHIYGLVLVLPECGRMSGRPLFVFLDMFGVH